MRIDAYIVHQSDALDVQMLPVEGVLKEFHNIVSNGVLCGEAYDNHKVVNSMLLCDGCLDCTFGPCEKATRIEGRLFNREREGQTQR